MNQKCSRLRCLRSRHARNQKYNALAAPCPANRPRVFVLFTF
ncbi:hypothetical protein BN135_1071 [Cronobacter muytjensii 530]